ncbi:MAG TPA: SOS response-associated peptidase family protein, partial [Myxococcales bacterium]|nr:SOS response-associated peptidase family protein [Myxococcales bacterium]
MKGIHNRMPAILPRAAWGAWLDPRNRDVDELMKLLAPYGQDDLEAYPVSPLVNSPDNESAECVAPAAPPPKKQLELF